MIVQELAKELEDEALRCIGRNIVDFQKIEALLKALVFWGEFCGPIEDIKTIYKQQAKATNRKTLGTLVTDYEKRVLCAQDTSALSDDCSAPAVAISFRLDMSREDAKIKARELGKLVVERNRLIHRELAVIDFGSADSCRELIEALNDQNARMRKHIHDLSALWTASIEARKHLLAFMETEQFQNALAESMGPNELLEPDA